MKFVKGFLSVGLIFLASVISVHLNSEDLTDTVVLKNKKELIGVRAVYSSDFWTVTSADGEKVLYKKDEVLEIKKTDPKKEEILKPYFTRYGIWSPYLGELNWESAENKCKSMGMRLPDRTELLLAFKSGAYESWKKDNTRLWFWTSEDYEKISGIKKDTEDRKAVPDAGQNSAEESPENRQDRRPALEAKKVYNVNLFNGEVFLRDSDTLNSLRCIR